MQLIWIIVIGLVAGMMGKDLKPGQEPVGFWVPALMGMAGALLVFWLGQMAGWYRSGQPLGFVAGVIGASLAVSAFNTLRRLRKR